MDLSFEHVAAFGRDDRILDLLAEELERTRAPDGVRRRFAELAARSEADGPPP